MQEMRHFLIKKFSNLKRCTFIADGYYEWKNTCSGKIPFFHYENDFILLEYMTKLVVVLLQKVVNICQVFITDNHIFKERNKLNHGLIMPTKN